MSNNVSNISIGLKIPIQIPLDAVKFSESEAVLSNLGTSNNLAYTYYQNLEVTCQEEGTKWLWREVVDGDVQGLIPVNFAYPPNWIVDHVNYSNRVFNFFLIPAIESISSDLETVKENLTNITKGFTGKAYAVWTGVGFIYDVTYSSYYINNILYPAGTGQITLTPSALVNPRLDAIIVNALGASFLTGSAQASPYTPIIDNTLEIFISTVLINPNTIVPADTSQEVIYKENVEWATSSSIFSIIDFNAIVNPFEGVKHIDVGAYTVGILNFTHTGFLQALEYDALSFRILLKDTFVGNKDFGIFLNNSIMGSASALLFLKSDDFNFEPTLVNIYQNVLVPISAFDFINGTSFDFIQLIAIGDSLGFSVDNIVLHKGLSITTPKPNGLKSIVTDNGTTTVTQPNDIFTFNGIGGTKVSADGKILKFDTTELKDKIDTLENQTDVSNVFVTMTGYSFLANVLTINAAWFWKLLGILYTNATSVNETIPYCAAGKTRIDYVVPNNTNGFTRISGPETLGTAIAPQIPANGLYVTYFIVTDSSIGVPKNPNVNNIPDLQKVLETGYATKEIIWFYNETDSRCIGLNSERIMFQKNESIFNRIDSSLTTESYTSHLPNKTGGADETFAMVSDVSTSLASANLYTDGKVAGLYKVKGSVANYAALPSTGQVVGDVWNLTDTGANYVWTGTVWDELGTTVNLSGLAPIASPTFTGTVVLPATTSIGSITSTIIGYLSGLSSNAQTQLNSKQSLFSGITNFLPKSSNATTLVPSRIQDTGTYVGIGTTKTPIIDIAFGNQSSRTVGIEESVNLNKGSDFLIKAGRTINYSDGVFTYYNSFVGSNIIINDTNDIYITVGSNIYKRTNSEGSFDPFGGTGYGLKTIRLGFDNNIFIISDSGFLVQYNSTGSFLTYTTTGFTGTLNGVAINTTTKDIYLSNTGGLVYKQTGGSGNFINLNVTSRSYSQMITTMSGQLFAWVYNVGMFEFNGTDFIRNSVLDNNLYSVILSVAKTSNALFVSNPYLIATVKRIDVNTYTSTTFATLNTVSGVAEKNDGSFLACTLDGVLIKPVGVGTANLDGGTLKNIAGTGKGTGKSRYEIYTGQKQPSGTDMQVETLREYIDENGYHVYASVPVYADNAAAVSGGLPVGCQYRTATGISMIVY